MYLVSGQIPTSLIPTRLNLNSGWTPMAFNVTQSSWIPNKFKISAPETVQIQFTDAYCPGKMVAIYVDDKFLMNSTIVPLNSAPEPCKLSISYPSGAENLPNLYSHANFTLPLGEHEISIKVIQSIPNLDTGVMFIKAQLDLPFNCDKAN